MSRMYHVFFALCLCLLSLHAQDWKIAIAPDAPIAEMTAAKELQKEMKALFGKELPIVKGNPASPAIRLGTSAENAKRLGVDFDKLKYDEIILKTVDGDVVLAGSRPRGTLYAVYEYLERYYGVRFWTATETEYPKQAFKIAKPDYRFAPPIEYRYYYSNIMQRNKPFAVKMRNNWSLEIPDELGGYDELGGWCHTFDQMLPASQYFKDHPEYYAMRDGKRQNNLDRTQLCLTNPDVLKEMTEQVMKRFRKYRGQVKAWAVSQNDSQNYCTCPKCEEFVKKHGNQTDLMLYFVNAIADEVKKEFPENELVTLAYQYTRALPKTITPRDNVAIHLCSIECCFNEPMDSETNKKFAEEVRAWAKITKRLYIWNYVTNYHAFHLPHPNFKPLAQDIRFFLDNHMVGLFEQGANGLGEAGDLTWLRAYLISKLMWDPSLDQEAVTQEFLNGYYGAAGKYIYDYMNLVQKSCEDAHIKLRCYMPNVNWFTPEQMTQAYALFQQAFAAVKDDPVKTKRVDFAMYSLKAAILSRPQVMKQLMPNTKPVDLVDELIATAKASKGHRYGEEYRDLDYWRKTVINSDNHKKHGTKPPFITDNQEWYDVTLGDFPQLAELDRWIFRVNDDTATNGKALLTTTAHTSWFVQLYQLPDDGAYDIYIAARCPETGKSSRPILTAGLYNGDLKTVIQTSFSTKDLTSADGSYRFVKFGRLPENYSGRLYICTIPEKGLPTKIYLDRIIFVKTK